MEKMGKISNYVTFYSDALVWRLLSETNLFKVRCLTSTFSEALVHHKALTMNFE